MWTRAALKEKAKSALSRNYWKVILVTLIVFIIGGASTGNTGININSSDIESVFNGGFSSGYTDDFYYDEDWDYEDDFYFEDDFSFDDEDTFYYDTYQNPAIEAATDFVFGAMIIIILIVAIIALIIGFFFSVFIYCPLEVGTKRFFFKNLNQPAEVKEVAYAFDNNYKNVVKVLFFRELYLLGWSLLFVIPGIVKSYEYLMVPYLLAENPNLTKEEAFALSKQMMMGHKWDAFVLSLSFIGWDILSGATLGILGIFYVEPYKCLTFAALYEELSLMNGRPAQAHQNVEATYQYQQVNPYWENTQSVENPLPIEDAQVVEETVVEQSEDEVAQDEI